MNLSHRHASSRDDSRPPPLGRIAGKSQSPSMDLLMKPCARACSGAAGVSSGIEAPWLVNGGHGASFRHHKHHKYPYLQRGRRREQRCAGGGARLQRAAGARYRYFMIRTEAAADITLSFCPFLWFLS
eukprot:COSAG01_NODE_23_length_37704_cov_30.005877_12_plen_128_part_00